MKLSASKPQAMNIFISVAFLTAEVNLDPDPHVILTSCGLRQVQKAWPSLRQARA